MLILSSISRSSHHVVKLSRLRALRGRRAGDLCLLTCCCCDFRLLAIEDDFGLFEISSGIYIIYVSYARHRSSDGNLPSSMSTRLR